MFNIDDIIVWHNIAHGPKEYRVVWVYNDEPKTLLITDNIDDLTRHGLCFHAPMHECRFVRKGIEFKQTRKVTKHGDLPDFLRDVDTVREDI